MIITIGGIKGGSGKSTFATNLTVYLALQGKDVLLVDADEQETATDFTKMRNESLNGEIGYTAIQLFDKQVRTEIPKFIEKYDFIIVDVGGRDVQSQRAALLVSDIYLVPFVPKSFDLWTMEKVEQLVEEAKINNPSVQCFTFLNRADPKGSDNQDSRDMLVESSLLTYLDFPIGQRKAFSNSAGFGFSVLEAKPKDLRVIQELTDLINEIFKRARH